MLIQLPNGSYVDPTSVRCITSEKWSLAQNEQLITITGNIGAGIWTEKVWTNDKEVDFIKASIAELINNGVGKGTEAQN